MILKILILAGLAARGGAPRTEPAPAKGRKGAEERR